MKASCKRHLIKKTNNPQTNIDINTAPHSGQWLLPYAKDNMSWFPEVEYIEAGLQIDSSQKTFPENGSEKYNEDKDFDLNFSTNPGNSSFLELFPEECNDFFIYTNPS